MKILTANRKGETLFRSIKLRKCRALSFVLVTTVIVQVSCFSVCGGGGSQLPCVIPNNFEDTAAVVLPASASSHVPMRKLSHQHELTQLEAHHKRKLERGEACCGSTGKRSHCQSCLNTGADHNLHDYPVRK